MSKNNLRDRSNQVEIRRTKSGAVVELRDVQVADTLINTLSGLGTARDRNAHADFVRNYCLSWDYPQLEAMYSGNWIAANMIDVPAEDMTREWRTIDADEVEPGRIEEFEGQEVEFNIKNNVTQCLKWARLYGGAMLFPVFRPASRAARDLREPLTLDMIRPGDLEGFNIIEPRYVFPAGYTSINPGSMYYLRPEYYTLTGAESMFVHESRFIRFSGRRAPRQQTQRMRYWGYSILEAARDAIVNAFTASGAVSSMISEANIDIISVENLGNSLMAGGEANIQQRYEMYYLLKSMFNVTLVDSKETYSNRQLNFANLDKIIDQMYAACAGAAKMPVTKLLGISPGGLNATGESDTTNYYDVIKSQQEEQLLYPLMQLDQVLARNLWGAEVELPFNFESLWQEDPDKRAARELTEAQTDKIYLEMGVVDEHMVLQQLKERGTYSNITKEKLAEMENRVKQAEEEYAQALANGGQTPNQPVQPGQQNANVVANRAEPTR